MMPKFVINAILTNIADQTGMAVPLLMPFVPLAINHGIEHDSDAVFITKAASADLVCGVVVGASLLVGTGVRQFLQLYRHGDEAQIVDTLDGVIQNAIDSFDDDAFAAERMIFYSLQGNYDRWRSFCGERLKDLNEVVVGVQRDMN